MPKTPWEIAEAWYSEPEVAEAIGRSGGPEMGAWDRVPDDVDSPEFAHWLAKHLQRAMAKGIQLGRGETSDWEQRSSE